MAGVTPQGFETYTFSELQQKVSEEIRTKLGQNIDSSPDNVLKILTNILLLPTSQNWSATQALQSMWDITQATGEWLDRLCANNLVYRREGSTSKGLIRLTISEDNVLTIPAGTDFYSESGRRFYNSNIINLNKSSVGSVRLFIDPSYVGLISIKLDGVDYLVNTNNYTSVNSAIKALQTILDGADYFTDLVGNELEIYKSLDKRTVFSFTTNIDMTGTTFLDGYFQLEYEELGSFFFSEGVITQVPAFTVIEDYYSYQISGGLFTETDEELRERYFLTLSVGGSRTTNSLRSRILLLEGVENVSVVENDSLTFDVENNVDAKSIRILVKGGDKQEIAQTVWDYKAATVATYGEIPIIVLDSQNNEQVVNLSEFKPVYIYVQVEYERYAEEDFPVDGEDAIKDVVVSYGESLEPAADVIQGRIESQLYRNITGLGNVTVSIAATEFPDDPVGAYSSTVSIPISTLEEANFDLTRVTVTEV